LLPTLDELSKKFHLYVHGDFAGAPGGLEILKLRKNIRLSEPPDDAICVRLKVRDKNEPIEIQTQEPRYKGFARQACVAPKSFRPRIKLDARSLRRAGRLLPQTNRKCIGAQFLASHEERSMDIKHATSIIEALTEKYHVCVFHTRPTHEGLPNVTCYSGQINTADFIHMASFMDGIVSVDGGLAHLGGAYGIPTIAIYGPTGPGGHIRFEEPYGEHMREIWVDMPCRPCYYHNGEGCRPAPKCFNVKPATVVEALEELMKKTKPVRRGRK